MQPLTNTRCLITGASRGIGAAVAQRFAAQGASCTLVGRHRETLEELCAALPSLRLGDGERVNGGENDGGGAGAEREGSSLRHRVEVGNVGERGFWKGVAEREKDIDVLINAAGITHYSLLAATQSQTIEDVMRTNLMGSIWGCQMLVKNMIRRRRAGCIINISSLLGVKGGKGSTVYAASKAGILGLTRSLAAEVGPMRIRVNAIVPGYIETQMTEAMTPEARSHALEQVPLRRFGMAEEVADAAMFLARNEYANNCVLNLDGGLSAT